MYIAQQIQHQKVNKQHADKRACVSREALCRGLALIYLAARANEVPKMIYVFRFQRQLSEKGHELLIQNRNPLLTDKKEMVTKFLDLQAYLKNVEDNPISK